MAMPAFNDVSAAYFRIGDWVRKTPLVASKYFSDASKSQVFLKLENLQMSGSYKERGALNALLSLLPEQKKNGVIAASAGNHAQGVAFHAKRLGISAKIVMPEQTPLIKVKRTQDFGAEVVLFGEGFDEAYQKAQELTALEDRHFIHHFNDPAVVAGQGTIALELEGKKVCCILSGGNIDVNVISRIIERGLVREGRLRRIRVEMPDYYGNLARVTQLIASNQANIIKVDHDGMFASVPIGMTAVEFTIETYNTEHAERVLKAIETQGFPVKKRCA
jgi:threonine dehydratase